MYPLRRRPTGRAFYAEEGPSGRASMPFSDAGRSQMRPSRQPACAHNVDRPHQRSS